MLLSEDHKTYARECSHPVMTTMILIPLCISVIETYYCI